MATPRLAELGSRRLSDSPSFSFKHSKADSPTRRVGESLTPRLTESESQRIPDSPSRRVTDSPTRWVGESFFDYEYLRELEAKSGTARKVVWGIHEDPISAKTPENPPHCHVPLSPFQTFQNLRRYSQLKVHHLCHWHQLQMANSSIRKVLIILLGHLWW